MKSLDDFLNQIFDLAEDDGTDALTLTNLILNKDMRHLGFNWGNPIKQVEPKQVLNVAGKQLPTTFMHEAEQQPQQQQEVPTNVLGMPIPADGKIQTTTGQIIDLERNKKDPNIISSFPEVNNCPAFYMKDPTSAPICRVTNRVCIYMNNDYKSCGIYNLASAGDPSSWELPYGREQQYSYITGLKF